jgi:hypothetical protein
MRKPAEAGSLIGALELRAVVLLHPWAFDFHVAGELALCCAVRHTVAGQNALDFELGAHGQEIFEAEFSLAKAVVTVVHAANSDCVEFGVDAFDGALDCDAGIRIQTFFAFDLGGHEVAVDKVL